MSSMYSSESIPVKVVMIEQAKGRILFMSGFISIDDEDGGSQLLNGLNHKPICFSYQHDVMHLRSGHYVEATATK